MTIRLWERTQQRRQRFEAVITNRIRNQLSENEAGGTSGSGDRGMFEARSNDRRRDCERSSPSLAYHSLAVPLLLEEIEQILDTVCESG